MLLSKTNLAGIAFGIFLVLSVGHYRHMISWDIEAAAPYWVLALGLALVLAATALGVRGRKLELTLSGACVVAFFGYACLVALVFGVEPLKAISSSIAAMVIVSFFIVFRGDILEGRVIHISGAILFAYLLYLFAVLPVRPGFTLGGIQPNQFAKLGLAILVLGHTTNGWLRRLSLAIAILCVLIATSRAGMVFLAVFITVYYLPSSVKNRAFVATFGTSIALFLLMADSLINAGLTQVFGSKILLLNDPTLGLGSGFSGRDKYWANGLEAIQKNPMGWGYNTRGVVTSFEAWNLNAHQGYLNMVLDTGLIGLAIFICALSAFLIGVWRMRRTHDNAVLRSCHAFGLSYPLIMLLDPIYFSVGLPLSAIFLGYLSMGFGKRVVWTSFKTARNRPRSC